jgi:methylenetetrahydrofolate dehydrogenase (NADP+)/methenyltetrahydrofolate cyclohydrolase
VVLSELKTEKDVDGLTPKNQGLLLWNQGAILPCTPRGIMELLHHYQIPIQGQRAVVIGRSLLVGRSIGLLLDQAGATVTTIHSATPNPEQLCRDADLVIAAAGVPGLVRGSWLKPGCAVVDVGIHRVEGSPSLVGDVLESEALGRAAFLTPVPGGVGPMTMAMLMRNTVELYLRFGDQGATM